MKNVYEVSYWTRDVGDSEYDYRRAYKGYSFIVAAWHLLYKGRHYRNRKLVVLQ